MHHFMVPTRGLSFIHLPEGQVETATRARLIPQNQNRPRLSFRQTHSTAVQTLTHMVCRDRAFPHSPLTTIPHIPAIQGSMAPCPSLETIWDLMVLDSMIPVEIPCKVPHFQKDLIPTGVPVSHCHLHFNPVVPQILDSILPCILKCIITPRIHSILPLNLSGPS